MHKLRTAKVTNFLPDYLAEKVIDINFAHLQAQGVEAVCLDLDSTLLQHGAQAVSEDSRKFLAAQPLPVFIVTNRRESAHVKEIAAYVEARLVFTAQSFSNRKPQRSFYANVSAISGYKPSQLVMVGDRVIQDVWGANRAGFKTIMVEKLGRLPLHEYVVSWIDWLYVRLIRSRYISL